MINEINQLDCIIIGINNSIFSNRQVTKTIDWNKIYEDDKALKSEIKHNKTTR